jgi:hypothetical protein
MAVITGHFVANALRPCQTLFITAQNGARWGVLVLPVNFNRG